LIVHGQDRDTLTAVSRFLERLNIRVDVLQQRADDGMVLLHKIEAAKPTFVVALLTPDDTSADGARARQNAIFELGFFMAKLGRERVRVLHKRPCILPSDLSGLLTVDLDSPTWRNALATELLQAGFQFSAEALSTADARR
jgi:predicted nucleotide-binding protein